METKICSVCKEVLSLENFYKRHRYCKKCFGEKQKIYNEKNKEIILIRKKKYSKEYDSRPEVIERRRKYRQENKEKLRATRQKWAEENREKDNNYKRKYRARNKDKEYEYQKNRRQTNINYRLVGNLRHRIWMALEGKIKSKSTKKLLGCSVEEFKLHLESKFEPGMTWENYGEKGWHVGHIIPCKFFDLSNKREQAICFNYNNLKPQWETENLSENDKLPDGRRARNLTKEEKLEYLKSLGYKL